MNQTTTKTYADCYVYNMDKIFGELLFKFVNQVARINKASESFEGVLLDIKRSQPTSILYNILLRPDVVLALGDRSGIIEAFKVFACADVKNVDKKLKFFIDCTNNIELKNGYYVCKNPGVLCARLMSVMTHMLYHKFPERLKTNSAFIQAGAECFAKLAQVPFAYFNPNGYSENKRKIMYILAVYYQVCLLGLNHDDTSVKNLAAKIAGFTPREIGGLEMYYDVEDLKNINTLITSIIKNFKFNMAFSTYIEKWTYSFGKGTLFGSEYFPAFSAIITDAYSGTYINQQRTIEANLGKAMVNYVNILLSIAENCIARDTTYESSLDREEALRRSMIIKEISNSLTLDQYKANVVLQQEDFDNALTDKFKEKITTNIISNDEFNQSKAALEILRTCIKFAQSAIYNQNAESEYKNGLSLAYEYCKPYLKPLQKDEFETILRKFQVQIVKQINTDGDDKYHTEVTQDIVTDINNILASL